ncbi:hypothetical protein IFM89_009679 [Coptis chinensis]|uniref:Peptidase A1 domain-containing protein n=1 Tax=Coptis chinensis TaxID=261450 RepID=A0A835M842_9MAGN|nr:hypothetical protein IFM89_009679 [Coptis chinensis]
MPSLLQLFFPIFFLIITSCQAQKSFRPSALVLPVTKDVKTLQYVTTITQRTPPVLVKLVVDLGGQFVWIDCQSSYISSSYRPARCGSSQCKIANAHSFCSTCNNIPSPICSNNTCELSPQNGVTEFITGGDVTMDVLSLKSTNGYKPGVSVSVPQFIFACTRSFLLEGLAEGTKGIAAFGRTRIALPTQLAAAFSLHRKFAMCLSPSMEAPGAIFFGDGPYSFFPGSDVSKSLTYTKLINNPKSTNGVALRGEPSFEYFIGVTSVTINGKQLPLNSSLLSIGKNGVGGTKLSTVAPYSILETSVYKALTETFIREAVSRNITRVASVAPFGACFSSKSIVSIRGRLQVPSIDLVLQSKSVTWPIYPTNSLVKVSDDVMCLGFIDGNSVEDVDNKPRASIVLGGYQLENNFIQFDLATSRVGFTSMPYEFTAGCANFRSSV